MKFTDFQKLNFYHEFGRVCVCVANHRNQTAKSSSFQVGEWRVKRENHIGTKKLENREQITRLRIHLNLLPAVQSTGKLPHIQRLELQKKEQQQKNRN